MTYTEMEEAVRDAKATLHRADAFTAQMAAMIVGRLRKGHVSRCTLKELKDELRKYNVHTGTWRD